MNDHFQNNHRKEASFQNESKVEQDPRCKGLRWWAAGAVLGLVGAFVFPLLVGVLVRITAADPVAHPILRSLTTISALSIVPLLVFGGYCLNQAMNRATPEPYGCSRGQLPDRSKASRNQAEPFEK